MPDYKNIGYEIADRVLTITLDRPEVLNAVTEEMLYEIVDAFDQADRDDEVRAIIMTGRGRAFCAGADLSGGSAFDYGDENHRDVGGIVTLRMFDCLKPIIAAINGPAVGVGVTMTLAADIRLAVETARFGFVFSRRGIVPESASAWFLPRIVGISQALEWAYAGRVFPATEALAGGLVKSLHAPDELLPRARELALEIAENTSGVSVALSRQLMWKMLGADHPMEAHRWDSRGVAYMGGRADAKEGVASFLERRPPAFTMKPSQDMPSWFPWWPERTYE